MSRGIQSSAIRNLPALFACVFVLSCATPPATVESPAPALVASIKVEDASIQGLDIDSVRITVNALVSNEGEAGITLGSLDFTALPGGTLSAKRSLPTMLVDGKTLAPGERAAFRLELELDAPEGASPWIDLRLDAAITFRDAAGRSGAASTVFDTRFPRIIPPVLVIRSIRIIKDELINTRLGVELAVRNPNVFPLSFASLDYKLYSEGRYWAGDSLSKSFEVPPGQIAEANLYMTMNFTDMDRSLLDRVIRLATVSYRLGGMARIDTGLGFLPRFELPFDLSGITAVLR